MNKVIIASNSIGGSSRITNFCPFYTTSTSKLSKEIHIAFTFPKEMITLDIPLSIKQLPNKKNADVRERKQAPRSMNKKRNTNTQGNE